MTMSSTITGKRFVITVTIKNNEPGSTPVDVTWYRGENHAEALAALVQAGARDIGGESLPERMRASVQSVRLDIYPLDPEPEADLLDDEPKAVSLDRIRATVMGLAGDGQGGELGENPEYTRACYEIARDLGVDLSTDLGLITD